MTARHHAGGRPAGAWGEGAREQLPATSPGSRAARRAQLPAIGSGARESSAMLSPTSLLALLPCSPVPGGSASTPTAVSQGSRTHHGHYHKPRKLYETSSNSLTALQQKSHPATGLLQHKNAIPQTGPFQFKALVSSYSTYGRLVAAASSSTTSWPSAASISPELRQQHSQADVLPSMSPTVARQPWWSGARGNPAHISASAAVYAAGLSALSSVRPPCNGSLPAVLRESAPKSRLVKSAKPLASMSNTTASGGSSLTPASTNKLGAHSGNSSLLDTIKNARDVADGGIISLGTMHRSSPAVQLATSPPPQDATRTHQVSGKSTSTGRPHKPTRNLTTISSNCDSGVESDAASWTNDEDDDRSDDDAQSGGATEAYDPRTGHGRMVIIESGNIDDAPSQITTIPLRAARVSRTLAHILRSSAPFREGAERRITLPHLSASVVDDICAYLVSEDKRRRGQNDKTGVAFEPQLETVLDLLVAAHYLGIDGLVTLCTSVVVENFYAVDTFGELPDHLVSMLLDKLPSDRLACAEALLGRENAGISTSSRIGAMWIRQLASLLSNSESSTHDRIDDDALPVWDPKRANSAPCEISVVRHRCIEMWCSAAFSKLCALCLAANSECSRDRAFALFNDTARRLLRVLYETGSAVLFLTVSIEDGAACSGYLDETLHELGDYHYEDDVSQQQQHKLHQSDLPVEVVLRARLVAIVLSQFPALQACEMRISTGDAAAPLARDLLAALLHRSVHVSLSGASCQINEVMSALVRPSSAETTTSPVSAATSLQAQIEVLVAPLGTLLPASSSESNASLSMNVFERLTAAKHPREIQAEATAEERERERFRTVQCDVALGTLKLDVALGAADAEYNEVNVREVVRIRGVSLRGEPTIRGDHTLKAVSVAMHRTQNWAVITELTLADIAASTVISILLTVAGTSHDKLADSSLVKPRRTVAALKRLRLHNIVVAHDDTSKQNELARAIIHASTASSHQLGELSIWNTRLGVVGLGSILRVFFGGSVEPTLASARSPSASPSAVSHYKSRVKLALGRIPSLAGVIPQLAGLLAHAPPNTQVLRKLSLRGSRLVPRALSGLLKAVMRDHSGDARCDPEVLDVGDNFIAGEAVAELAALVARGGLRELHMPACSCASLGDDEIVQILTAACASGCIQVLDVSGHSLGRQSAKALVPLVNSAKRLILRSNNLVFEDIASLITHRGIREQGADICNVNCDGDDMEDPTLHALYDRRDLLTVDIAHNYAITDDYIARLQALGSARNVLVLSNSVADAK